MKRYLKVFFIVVLALTISCESFLPVFAETPANAKSKETVFNVTRNAKGTFFGKNKVITLKGVPGVWTGNSGSSNYARFNIYYKNELIATQDFAYNSSMETISYNYPFQQYGEYKITFSHLKWNSTNSLYVQEYIKEAVIKVVKPTKASKTYPIFTASNNFDGSTWSNRIQIAGLDSNATTAIYRAESKSGEYKLLTKVNDSVYIDELKDADKTYYYKIRAYVKSGKKTYKSKKSKAVKVMLGAPSKPVVKKVELIPEDEDSLRLKISWDKSVYDESIKIAIGYSTKSGLQVSDMGNSLGYSTGDKGAFDINIYDTLLGWKVGKGETYYFYIWAYTESQFSSLSSSISDGYKFTFD